MSNSSGSQPTISNPWAPVIFSATGATISGAVTFWIISGSYFDGRHLVAFLGGIVFTMAMISRTWKFIQAANRSFGMWIHPEHGELTFDADDWTNHAHLAGVIQALEADGYVPSIDPRTTKFRMELGVDG